MTEPNEITLQINEMPVKKTTENAITENAITENAITENAITENTITENAITENAITENAITENAITENAITEKFNLKMLNLLKDYHAEMQAFKDQEMTPKMTQEMTPKMTQEMTREMTSIHKNALLIGCNYRNTTNELYGCINDATNIAQVLKNAYGFGNIKLMTDDTPTIPSKNNILAEIKALLDNATSGDLLFLSFSGHGMNVKDKNGDEKDGLDEVLVSINFELITDDELNRLIRKHLKKNVTLFALFDCCHSGTILDLRYQYLDSTKSNQNTVERKYSETAGNVIMISGCMDKQTSMDAYIKPMASYQGAMTYVFLEAIKKNPTLSWLDLLKTMRGILRSANYSQIPQLSSGKKLDLTRKFLSV